ncbi:MAG: hypothetical protein Q7L55_10270 [Actinomycetota bacterium]|nr:hypothetical protein [Actinomycetota bacterium]
MGQPMRILWANSAGASKSVNYLRWLHGVSSVDGRNVEHIRMVLPEGSPLTLSAARIAAVSAGREFYSGEHDGSYALDESSRADEGLINAYSYLTHLTASSLFKVHPSLAMSRAYRETFRRRLSKALRLRLRPTLASSAEIDLQNLDALFERLNRLLGDKASRDHVAGVRQLRRLAEWHAPQDPGLEHVLEFSGADCVVVSKLYFPTETHVMDVRVALAARRRGTPVVMIPYSWDNGTTKGTTSVSPDGAVYWNATLAEEAARLHGLDVPYRIGGAYRFSEAHRRYLDAVRDARPADPYDATVLILGSSGSMGQGEPEVLLAACQELIGAAQHGGVRLRVVMRKHPKHPPMTPEVAKGFQDLAPDVTVDVRGQIENLADAIMAADVVIGVNSSAILEAALSGKSTIILVDGKFDVWQRNAPHFQYLLDSGMGTASIAELPHRVSSLIESRTEDPSSAAFVRDFLGNPAGPPDARERTVAAIAELATELVAGPVRRIGASPQSASPALAIDAFVRDSNDLLEGQYGL